MHTGRLRQLLALVVAGLLIAGVWRLAWGQQGGSPSKAEQNGPEVALGTAFTYQGTLELDGNAVDDTCDFRFSLWNSAAEPTGQVGSTVQKASVGVVEGQFLIPDLDFGATAFGSQVRWLEIEVRCPGGNGSYTMLQPRQPMTPAPASIYASRAGSVDWTGIGNMPAGFADGVDNNTTYSAGSGLALNGTEFSANFDGSGTASAVARSDHDHWGQTWSGSDFGLTLSSQSTFANSAALRAQSFESQGTGVQGFVGPSNTSAAMTVPTAVSGISLAPAGGFANRTYGVYGEATGTGGYGVYGSGSYTGTVGLANSSNGIGVYGVAAGGGTGVQGAGVNGVYGRSTVNSGTGILGEANTGSLAFGVWGISSQGYAGYFSGKVNITGNLTKSGGSFLIDHPLDPANKYLAHSFVESPDMKNIYDGLVTLDEQGEAVVTMPDWFEALNQEFRYQLTCVGGYAPVYISREIEGNQFAIAGGTPGLKVSWQVTGTRHDPWAENNRIQVEVDKSPAEAGTYLYPEGYDLPPSYGLTYEREAALEAASSPTLRADDHWSGPVEDAPLPLVGGEEGQ